MPTSLATFDMQPTLDSPRLRLRPMAPEDFEPLYEVARDPLIWEQHPARDRWQRDAFRGFFESGMASGGALVALDRTAGVLIGGSRFYGWDPVAREVEIGWTFLARAHWGGPTNAEMKALMLAHAFRWVDTVVFFIGERNVRSQRSVERLGAALRGPQARFGADHLVYALTRKSCRLTLHQE